MSLYQQFQEGSITTKVVSIILFLGIVGAVVCGCGLLAWFLLTGGGSDTAFDPATPPVAFVTPIPPAPTSPPEAVEFTGWRGQYYDNPELDGEPVAVRDDERIDFDWGCQPPVPGVPPENFSVRWSISRDIPAGIYRVDVNVNDGVRLWVDDVLILDEWRTGPTRTLSAAVNLAAGTHNIRLEYFNAECPSLIQATARYLQNFPDWKGEYFDNPTVAGSPQVIRNDSAINFNWGTTSPIPGVIPDNNYSVRWTQTINFARGDYMFKAEVSGGVRIWLDGQILIDSWVAEPLRPLEATAFLDRGGHSFRVEYFKETGQGAIRGNVTQLEEPGEPPVAVISGPGRAAVGQPVAFSASDSRAAEGSALVVYEWDFGDGSKGSGLDITHIYQSQGVFAVTLTVIDDKGLSDTTTEEIEIVPVPVTPQPDQPPIPVIVAPAKARVGDVVTFDASQSVCANPCVSLAWNFGDGSTANAVRVQHVYLSPADYIVTLTLTDDKGLQGTSNTVIKIGEAKPTATPEPGATDTPIPTDVPTDVTTQAPLPTEPPEEIRPDAAFSINPPQAEIGQEVVFDASASEAGSSVIQTYQWNFGDGSPTQETGDPVITHVYGNSGGFQIVLNVINAQGLSDNTLNAIVVTGGEQPGETPEVELPIAPTETPAVEQPIAPTDTPSP
jgi:PKD repeat protein